MLNLYSCSLLQIPTISSTAVKTRHTVSLAIAEDINVATRDPGSETLNDFFSHECGYKERILHCTIHRLLYRKSTQSFFITLLTKTDFSPIYPENQYISSIS